MFRSGLRQATRQFSSRVAVRTQTARRSNILPAAAVVAPLLGYGLWQYNQAPIKNEEKNELTEKEIESETKASLIEEKDLQTDTSTSASSSSAPSDQSGGEGDEPQGAFNPETGEINWDCPCLGGMADGPCGEEFKAAFSCFVYSEAEPKGSDCIEKFSFMQDCFRKYPEVYSEEIRGDDPLEADAGDSVPTETIEGAQTTEIQDPAPAEAPAKN